MARWRVWDDGDGWREYVPVSERRANAARELAKRGKKGEAPSPVIVDRRRAIAETFWGKSWCDNLERYSDYSNRLPRGRTYVRNGSVVDLKIAAGVVTALVSGSSLYKIEVKVSAVPKARWTAVCKQSAGAIDSLVELLQGRFSQAVMTRMCEQRTGLFPSPSEIQFTCSCPDWASMCKHVAAVLYGIGARLDKQPELLFLLRAVNHLDLIAHAGTDVPRAKSAPAAGRILQADDLSSMFGIDIADATAEVVVKAPRAVKKKTKPKPPQAVSKKRK
jgi:uncharacterized Zn finger protein